MGVEVSGDEKGWWECSEANLKNVYRYLSLRFAENSRVGV